MSKAEEKFKKAVEDLIKLGIYPGPQRLNRLVHGHSSRNINGQECQWRREKAHELGFKLHGFNVGDRRPMPRGLLNPDLYY